jgi:hypothetical protein
MRVAKYIPRYMEISIHNVRDISNCHFLNDPTSLEVGVLEDIVNGLLDVCVVKLKDFIIRAFNLSLQVIQCEIIREVKADCNSSKY